MNVPARPLSRSPQRTSEIQFKTQLEQRQQAIANLAYALWQKRGYPDSLPEQEWLEAEQILRVERPALFVSPPPDRNDGSSDQERRNAGAVRQRG